VIDTGQEARLSGVGHRIRTEKMSGTKGILPRCDILFYLCARKIKKLEAGIHLASISIKPEVKERYGHKYFGGDEE
jgi:hypothetical protein